MELWFILSILVAFCAGAYRFMHNVAVKRDYELSKLNGFSFLISGFIGLFIAFVLEIITFTWYFLFLSSLTGTLIVLRHRFLNEALKYVNNIVILPIYKALSIIWIIILGYFVFGDTINLKESLAIVVSLSVPLILINKAEHKRQVDLKKGLAILLLASLLVAFGSAIFKTGVTLFDTIFLFTSIAQIIGGGFVLALYGAHRRAMKHPPHKTKMNYLFLAVIASIFAIGSYAEAIVLSLGTELLLFYIILSSYIVIPIVLTSIIYKEHWNYKKVLAVLLSILGVALLA